MRASKTNLDILINKYTTWPQNLLDPALLASEGYEAALVNVDIFKALDPDYAVVVTRTRDIVIFAMEEKIRSTQGCLRSHSRVLARMLHRSALGFWQPNVFRAIAVGLSN